MKKHPVLIAGLLSFAALLLIAVLLGIYRYDASCPLPALRKTLKQQEYEDCYFSSIRPVPVKRYITDPPETVYTYIEVRYKFHSFPPPERLF